MRIKYTKEQQAWIKSRPNNVRTVIKTHPPIGCYSWKNGRGHYVIYSYGEEKNGTVSLTVNHLEDSYLYGIQVFGVKPSSLIYCGCIVKEPPTSGRGIIFK